MTGTLTSHFRARSPLLMKTRKPIYSMPSSRVPPPSCSSCSSLPPNPASPWDMARVIGRVSRAGGNRKQYKPAPLTTATEPSKESNLLTVMIPQDSTGHQVETSSLKGSKKKLERGSVPSKTLPVGVRLSNSVEGWKRLTNDPYILSIVSQGYRLHSTSSPILRSTPWERRFPWDQDETRF